jgi:hypothetical protein
MPAAAPAEKIWFEIYLLIPIRDQSLAFNIWVDTNNFDLDNDLSAMKIIFQQLEIK